MTTHRRRFADLADEDFTPDEAVTLVERWEDVPEFTSETEAAAWWDTHSLADHLWSATRRGPPLHLAEQAASERLGRGLAEKEHPSSRAAGGSRALSGGHVVAGIVLGGLALAGGAYLLYALLKGPAAPAGFLPTGSRHLFVSPPRPGGVLHDLATLPPLTRVR